MAIKITNSTMNVSETAVSANYGTEIVSKNGKLRVELTQEERGGYDPDPSGAIAIIFRREDGNVIIKEEWAYAEETYNNGVVVTIPERIWKIGLAWLASMEPSDD